MALSHVWITVALWGKICLFVKHLIFGMPVQICIGYMCLHKEQQQWKQMWQKCLRTQDKQSYTYVICTEYRMHVIVINRHLDRHVYFT